MGCPCKNKNKQAAVTVAKPGVGAEPAKEDPVAASVKLEFVVRGSGHPLACEDCLGKHVGTAFVLATEVSEDRERKTERLLCLSNLRCAKDHAEALGREALTASLEEALGEFAKTGGAEKVVAAFDEVCGGDAKKRSHLIAVGHLSAAEQALRLCGGEEYADRIRSIRLDWTEKQHQSERTQE